jgi:hypothetical protein
LSDVLTEAVGSPESSRKPPTKGVGVLVGCEDEKPPVLIISESVSLLPTEGVILLFRFGSLKAVVFTKPAESGMTPTEVFDIAESNRSTTT